MKNNTISKDVQKLVLDEATKLKEHLHKDEIAKLNIETFDPTLSHGCVYGQVSGECHSIRAKHLLNACAVPYSKNIDKYIPATADDFHGRKLFVVGHDDVYSALEFVMFNNIHIREEVIKFLKSETDTINF